MENIEADCGAGECKEMGMTAEDAADGSRHSKTVQFSLEPSEIIPDIQQEASWSNDMQPDVCKISPSQLVSEDAMQSGNGTELIDCGDLTHAMEDESCENADAILGVIKVDEQYPTKPESVPMSDLAEEPERDNRGKGENRMCAKITATECEYDDGLFSVDESNIATKEHLVPAECDAKECCIDNPEGCCFDQRQGQHLHENTKEESISNEEESDFNLHDSGDDKACSIDDFTTTHSSDEVEEITVKENIISDEQAERGEFSSTQEKDGTCDGEKEVPLTEEKKADESSYNDHDSLSDDQNPVDSTDTTVLAVLQNLDGKQSDSKNLLYQGETNRSVESEEQTQEESNGECVSSRCSSKVMSDASAENSSSDNKPTAPISTEAAGQEQDEKSTDGRKNKKRNRKRNKAARQPPTEKEGDDINIDDI